MRPETSVLTPAEALRHGKTLPNARAKGRAIARSIDLAELRATYENGDSTVELERRYGVCRVTIRKLLRKAGCKLRDVREASRVRPAASWLRLDKPSPLRRRRKAKDVFGETWVVTHETTTRHGFAILRGVTGGPEAHAPSIIMTTELAAHLEQHRQAPRHLDLPISLTTVTRLRRTLGQDWFREKDEWWRKRLGDLQLLTSTEFGARHHVAAGTAAVAKRRYCGSDGRRHDWSDPDARAYVVSDLPLNEIATTLSISIGHARNLRGRFKKAAASTKD